MEDLVVDSMIEPVSIITAYKNAIHHHEDFISCIQAQTYPHWECLLINDSSRDSSPHEIDKLIANDKRFRHYSPPLPDVAGPALARNFALALCTFKYIAFCDIDDLWHPDKLRIQIAYQIAHNLDLTVTSYTRLNLRSGRSLVVIPPSCLSYLQLQSSNPIPFSSVIIKRSLAFDFQPVHHEDYLYWLNLFRKHPSLRYGLIRQNLLTYTIHNSNLTSRHPKLILWVFTVFLCHTQSPLTALKRTLCFLLKRFTTLLSTYS